MSVAVNTWPVVNRITAISGQLNPGQSTGLDVMAADLDGDSLSYAWTDNCGGSFSNAAVKSPTWTAPAVAPARGDCT